MLSEHLLKGMHVFEPDASWAKLTRAANWLGPGGFVNCAIAPLDIAMWGRTAADRFLDLCESVGLRQPLWQHRRQRTRREHGDQWQ